MKLEKESKEIDILIKSKPWTEKDLADFRSLMRRIKQKNRSKDSADTKSAKTSQIRKAV